MFDKSTMNADSPRRAGSAIARSANKGSKLQGNGPNVSPIHGSVLIEHAFLSR